MILCIGLVSSNLAKFLCYFYNFARGFSWLFHVAHHIISNNDNFLFPLQAFSSFSTVTAIPTQLTGTNKRVDLTLLLSITTQEWKQPN
jgi:hypothetical protein